MSEFLPYGRQSIDQADVEAVVAALHDPLITQGPRIARFEDAFADAVEARHAVAFANGTAALHGAAAAAALLPGDRVLTTPISFVASANCALFVGATPVFADIDSATGNLDTDAAASNGSLEAARACVAVSLAGLPVDLGPLQPAREKGVLVIEDGSHALGAVRDGRPVGGGLADMTTFSLHPVKAITTGEGGMVTTDSDELAERLRAFRTHGIRRGEPTDDPLRGAWHYDIETLGFNYRITDFQCALGHSQLARLEQFIKGRNRVAEQYRELLSGIPELGLPAAAEGQDRHAYHLFVVRFAEGAPRRRVVHDSLREAGVGTQLHYIPIPAHGLYRQLGHTMDGLPEAQKYWEQALSLPIFPSITRDDVSRVANELKRALELPLS